VRLLILGAGWLTGEIAARAVAGGDDVTCLARGKTSAAPSGATFVRADRDDPDAYDAIAGMHWDAVVDISTHPQRVRRAVHALQPNAQHCIYVSSASVYVDDRTPNQDESAQTHEPVEYGEPSDPELYGAHKVACERIVASAFGTERTTLIRPGLIGGPGDRSDRSGYWPIRFARPADTRGRVLIPNTPDLPTQVIDVRDLAAFVVDCARARVAGTFDAVGASILLAEHLKIAQSVADFTGTTVAADPEWLEAHDVSPWMGPRSLPMWLPMPDYAGFGSRNASAAHRNGLQLRDLQATLADTLAWERTREPGTRHAGLSDDDERSLLQELAP
jgi:2'-hydroxyisoflavone reductase